MPGPLPTFSGKKKPNARKWRIALVVAEWNSEITEAMATAAVDTLQRAGLSKKNILRSQVPGSFELPLRALQLAERKSVDAVICIGCVIKGETAHFEYICQAVAQGIMDVSLRTRKPVAFGVLTTLTHAQALDRAGGKYGNKGEEAAATVLQMLG